ncbi:hypothetical protein KF913_15515 [Candidatus Obscuribacterales bacterium]|nr:hypothetical protein [Candidatus Obscuribacterales bacterium]
MNFVQIIATLRKFGNYLAGIFPALVGIVDFFSKQLQKILKHPLIAPWWDKFAATPFAKSVWKLFERFYWRTYSKDRLDLEEAPPATVGLLRPLFQICALMCVLIPLTQFEICPVTVEAFSGFKGDAPAWSVWLWLLFLPFAWAALLVGTAISNRIAFSLTALAAANFVMTTVILMPRSFFNALLPVSLLIGLALCERTLPRTTRTNKIMSALNLAICGSAAAIPLIILTPIRPWLGTFVKLPGEYISIGGGIILGVLIGTAVGLWSQLPENHERPFFLRGAAISLSGCVWTIVSLLTVFLFAGVSRGDLGQSGGLILTSLELTTSYLWPIWYFIGVGILHKLMGSSKTFASAIEGMFPRVILAPLLVLGLLGALVFALSERLCLFLSAPTTAPALQATLPFFFQMYNVSKPYIWSNPQNVISVHWLTWVLLFDAIVIFVLAVQKRLTSAALVRLLFLTAFAALLIWEYVFQMTSFIRAPGHSVTALFFFAIWLLWLMHTVGWGISSKSSPCWPSAGRLAIYSGIATIALLDIHARSACKDFKLMNELFLTMFRGVIDVGLPYYFLVWTSKKVENIPVKISTLLGLFSLGALASFLFNALEKLAAASWNVPGMLRLVNLQYEQLKNTGSPNIDIIVPPEWYFIRALLYIALLALVYLIARARVDGTARGSQTILFVLVAFASGIASFSKTLLELPIPGEARALIAPSTQELLFNCNLFQSYASYWIPALMLGAAQIGKESRTLLFVILTPVAVAAHFAISWLYGEQEVYLRACDSLYLVTAAVAGVFVILVVIALERLKPSEFDETKPEFVSQSTLLTPKTFAALILTTGLIVGTMAIVKTNIKLEDRQLAALDHLVAMPPSWQDQTKAGDSSNQSITTFMRPSESTGVSLMQIGTVPSDPAGTQALLKQLLLKAVQSGMYPNFAVLGIESWGRYCPNALSCTFSYDTLQAPASPRSGISILIPRDGGKTEFYTVHTNPSDIAVEQAQLALMIRKVRDKLQRR